jgi:cytochrome c biogenesis protein CcmG/thiol:disulfide interchange protein DsbE
MVDNADKMHQADKEHQVNQEHRTDKPYQDDMDQQTDSETPGGNVNQNDPNNKTPPSSDPPQQSDSRKGNRVAIFGANISVGAVLAWVAVFALLLVLFFGLRRSQEGPVSIGKEAPDFTLTTFKGEEISLEDLEGKVVVLNFWASWCTPCEQEAADLENAWLQYKPRGDVVFLGIDYVDTETEALGYLEKFNISYPNAPDLGTRVSQAFRIQGVPETFIIGKDGKLVSFQKGPYSSLAQIKAVIDPLLEQ